MIWSLPQIWPYYNAYIFPYWSSFLLPIVQISLMSSVYTTVVMSWERYVRICLVSKLGCDYFSAGRFKISVGIIIIFPILFYIPKFFEVSFHDIKHKSLIAKMYESWNAKYIPLRRLIVRILLFFLYIILDTGSLTNSSIMYIRNRPFWAEFWRPEESVSSESAILAVKAYLFYF